MSLLDSLPSLPKIASSHLPNLSVSEREISLAGGLVLGFVVLKRPVLLFGAIVTALAAGLIYRGSTAYCPINNALGRNTAETAEPTVPDLVGA